MFMGSYQRPTDLDQGLQALAAGNLTIVAGGTDYYPARVERPLAEDVLDISGLTALHDIEQAIMICEEFLPQQPGHMSGHIVYGQALYEAGRLPESRVVFETAGGGGYGNPAERTDEQLRADLMDGKISPEGAASYHATPSAEAT